MTAALCSCPSLRAEHSKHFSFNISLDVHSSTSLLSFDTALAAMAFAAPHKRDLIVVVETETDVVWVTDVITVTADGVPAYTTSVSASLTSSVVTYTSALATSIPPAQTASVLHNHLVEGVSYYHLPHSRPEQTVSSATFISVPTLPTSIVDTPVYSSVAATSIYIPPVVATSVYVPPVAPTSVYVPPVITTTEQPQVPTTTAVPTTSAAPSADGSSIAQPTDYISTILAHHNIHRRNHSASDLVWDDALANTAAKIASSCKYAHDTDTDKSVIGGYGQNIAAGAPASNISAVITEGFYNGEVGWYSTLYGQSQPDMLTFEHWGHFSQIVWKATSKIGCATQQCSSLAGVAGNVPPIFTVCNYQGPGNVQNNYQNVGEGLGQPTIHWDHTF
ncbi:hypothetical protein AMS68_007352 [Peltaster fructicola]|uniref:SCP domain-containing protein n=1 Tax=Peltaster fructicola TaxID=286661 RepID=A0A6H0Y4I2_9PEZI|nr:hypothetical protein AMS68_007352 [Peltaster fructicola]